MEKITDIIIAAAILVGVWIFGCFMGVHHFRDEMETMQRDTVTVYDTMRYSRIELGRNTYTLKIPKVDAPNLAFLDVEKVDTIYKDNVMYITYPRENYYTKANDVEITKIIVEMKSEIEKIREQIQNIE